MDVVERRRSSTTVGLRRTRSVRSSLRLVGARWRTATANTANNNNVLPSPATKQELAEPSTVKFVSVTNIPSPTAEHPPPIPQPPPKQKNSRSWLPSFSYQQNKNLKSSSSNVGTGKVKEPKAPSKATWILGLTNHQNKQQKSKPVPVPTPSLQETLIPDDFPQDSPPLKRTWVLGLTEEQAQQTKPTSLMVLAEENNQPKISSPNLNNSMRQKSNSLSRSSPTTMEQFLQSQQPFLPVISSVGTKRRNSMWAVNSSKSKLQEGGMEFLVDGLTKTTKKKLDKINKINIHLHALFAAVEHGHVDRARTILESTEVDVNSVNSDGLSPLDVAVLSNNRQLAKMLVTFGAQEGNQFKSPESLGSHLKQLLAEAEQRVKELGGASSGGLMTLDETGCNNNNNNNHHLHNNINNRSSTSSSSPFSVIGSSMATAAMTGCSGGGSDATTDKQLLLWERRVKCLKKMLLGFDQARPPDVPFLVAVDVTGTNAVTVRFQEPEHQDSAICTKFKVQWSCNENFSPLAGEREILDMKQLECHIGDLNQGSRYYFRVACGNLKGYGNFRLSSPASVIPSSWRDVDHREPRFAGRLHLLDDLFSKIRHSRPECAAEIKATTTTMAQSGETPSVQRRNQRSKKTAIKQLFTVASKFQKNLRRGVFLACLLYHEDKVLVTNEDFLPVIEVDETYPSCIYHDFHWLMKVACTWDDVKSLRQDMERSLSSSAVHFRIKLLQAAAQMQAALCIQDLGQLYHKPIRDSQGTLVISTVNYVRSPKTVSVLNSRWLPLSKVQKKLATHEEPHVGELLMASIQEQITYHQVSSIRLNRGLYLGYLKMRSSVDLIQVVVPSKAPNVLPHCKIRDNPHVSSEEWEWLKRQSARHKTLGCSSSETLSSTSGDEQTGSEDGQGESFGCGTEQQRVFVEHVAATARRLFSYMDISPQEALTHRLYDAEVVDLSPEVSFLIVVPRAESACAVPGQTESLLQRDDLIALPVQVFEMVHLGTYQRDVISRYSRLSCILELDTVLAHHSHREAFSSSEVAAAKDRLAQLQDFQVQLNSAWKGVRWLMDVLTFARDRGCGGSSGSATTPGVAMRNLLALNWGSSGDQGSERDMSCNGKSGSSSCGGGSLKRSLLQLPPRDPKLVKSSTSRGSWPGPGVSTGSVANLLTAELSKSEQHLSSGRNGSSGSHSHSGELSSSNPSTIMTDGGSNSSFTMTGITPRLPPSRSEDTLLLAKQPPPAIRTHTRSRSSTITGSGAGSISSGTSVSASTSPLLSTRGASGGSVHSLSSSDDTTSPASTSTSKLATLPALPVEKQAEEEEDIATVATVVPAPAPGILQVYAAYETGLASGTSLKLHVTPWTTAREVVDLVVKQLNMAVVLKGKDGPIYPSDKLKNFCLVAVIGARERCLRDDFKPLQLQNPWKKGRLYVRQKQDVLAALEQSSRHTAYL